MTKEILCYSHGAVDLQINGALGLAFNNLQFGDEEKLQDICTFLWSEGVDAFLPTLVTTTPEALHRSMAVLQNYMLHQKKVPTGATMLGLHLEGPFLNPTKRGAHPKAALLALQKNYIESILDVFAPIVVMITLAPELDKTAETLTYLQELGICVSMGHSAASLEEAQKAIEMGVSVVTHVFNAMPSLHHREPGLLGAVLRNQKVWCGAIADGVHLHPVILDILYRLKGEKLFLVSDALAPYGLPDGNYPWDDREILVSEGTARLKDGILAGTTLSILEGVKRLVEWKICSLPTAIGLATEAPRQLLQNLLQHQNFPKHPLVWYRSDEEKICYKRINYSLSSQKSEMTRP